MAEHRRGPMVSIEEGESLVRAVSGWFFFNTTLHIQVVLFIYCADTIWQVNV